MCTTLSASLELNSRKIIPVVLRYLLTMTNNTTYNVHVVAGATASGKTDYAKQLAKELNGELINIDSRQVYKHMDIGTNKGEVLPAGGIEIFGQEFAKFKFSDGEVIHLLSFLTPDEQFNIYDFRALVFDLIPKLVREGKTPILVGGSGLYLSAILQPEKYQPTSDKFNPEYRSKLEAMSLGELQTLLIYYSRETFETMNDSDRANKRRSIRKLEILTGEGEIHGQVDSELSLSPHIHYMDVPIEQLTEKIDHRVIQMFDAGFVEEVRTLLKTYPPNTPALQGIGYAEVIAYLNNQGNLTLTECIRDVQIAHRQYAKRQLTWFKKYLPKPTITTL